MKTFTPGPWFVDAGMPDVIVDAKGEVIAEKVHGLDAQLISAAPEMLEALQGLLGAVNVRIDDPRIGLFDACRAAIAKATGDAP